MTVQELEKLAAQYLEGKVDTQLDFTNTQIALAHKTDEQLKKSTWIFSMMNKPWLVNIGSKLTILAIKLRLPFVESIIKNTIFDHFCGGTTLLESQQSIEVLGAHNVDTFLDYGVEAKQNEDDFNLTMNENLKAIEFASQNNFIPVVSSKITGLGRFGLFEKIQAGESLIPQEEQELKNINKRMDSICHMAQQKGVKIFFDAEESWIQDTLDHLVNKMMERYNKEKVVVYNTFQMYRHDRLQFLIDSFDRASQKGYLLGAKLVRGAYMEKERARAEEMGYESPIHPTKKATDDAYNLAIRFCIQNYDRIALCNASHNAYSNKLQAELMLDNKIPKDHSHMLFSQLYGMSDQLTFNLAKAGYNAGKYLVYG
ncbi:MAG: proline dehydrogenase family protein, partial [Bacteroidota bacterium]